MGAHLGFAICYRAAQKPLRSSLKNIATSPLYTKLLGEAESRYGTWLLAICQRGSLRQTAYTLQYDRTTPMNKAVHAR